MRKILFLFVFFLLSTATAWNNRSTPVVVAPVAVVHYTCTGGEMPLGEGEENSEEDKDITEEEDDDVSLSHRLHSRLTSGDSDLHILYQEILFKDLKFEVVIPPPRA